MKSTDRPQEKPPIDGPITSSGEDDLGRAPVAHDFAESIRELDASQGLVVGILGPWGHGKSSFINLMREQFETEPALTVVGPTLDVLRLNSSSASSSPRSEQSSTSVTRAAGKTADWLAQCAGILKPVSVHSARGSGCGRPQLSLWTGRHTNADYSA
jgi:hypothetical protein